MAFDLLNDAKTDCSEGLELDVPGDAHNKEI
jgi:hypothetical protein